MLSAGVLCAVRGKPCSAVPFYGEPLDPNIAVERVEPQSRNLRKYVLPLSAIAPGLASVAAALVYKNRN